MPDNTPGKSTGITKAIKAILLTICLLLVAEIAVRAGSYLLWKHGLEKYPEVLARFEGSQAAMAVATPDLYKPIADGGDYGKLPIPVAVLGGSEAKPEAANFHTIPIQSFEGGKLIDKVDSFKVRIACFGGSTTYREYPPALQEIMDKQFGPGVVGVFDFGIPSSSSWTSKILMTRFLPEIRPQFIIVYQGFNDLVSLIRLGFTRDVEANPDMMIPWLARPSYGLSTLVFGPSKWHFDPGRIEEAGQNYVDMAELAKAAGAELVLGTFAIPSYDTIPEDEAGLFEAHLNYLWAEMGGLEQYRNYIDRYNSMIVKLGGELGVEVADIAAAIKGGRDLFRDNCHKTNEGNRIHAQTVSNILKPKIEAILTRTTR